jgi:hypothetical protein
LLGHALLKFARLQITMESSVKAERRHPCDHVLVEYSC